MHEATFFGALATISSPKCCHYSGFQEHAVRSNSLNLSSMVRRDDGTYTQNVSTWQCLCLKLLVATLKNRISNSRVSQAHLHLLQPYEKKHFSHSCALVYRLPFRCINPTTMVVSIAAERLST